MTQEEAEELLRIPNKVVIRAFEWTSNTRGIQEHPWRVFESAIKINEEIVEGLRFIAKYRSQKKITRGQSVVTLPEKFSISLLANVSDRIFAIDTDHGQKHLNKVGKGLDYYNKIISSDTHKHIWIGSYGYVEPIEPPIYDIKEGLELFAQECNLLYSGPIIMPIVGEQQELI